jgi:hypothetical protein
LLNDGGIGELVKSCRLLYSQIFDIEGAANDFVSGNLQQQINTDELIEGATFAQQDSSANFGLTNAPHGSGKLKPRALGPFEEYQQSDQMFDDIDLNHDLD